MLDWRRCSTTKSSLEHLWRGPSRRIVPPSRDDGYREFVDGALLGLAGTIIVHPRLSRSCRDLGRRRNRFWRGSHTAEAPTPDESAQAGGEWLTVRIEGHCSLRLVWLC
jgi:hypothetical protein